MGLGGGLDLGVSGFGFLRISVLRLKNHHYEFLARPPGSLTMQDLSEPAGPSRHRVHGVYVGPQPSSTGRVSYIPT